MASTNLASASFVFGQLLTVATIIACQASSDASIAAIPLESKVDKSFFATLGIHDAVWDAFAEAALAIAVFGIASVALGSFRGSRSKTSMKAKSKAAAPLPQRALKKTACPQDIGAQNAGAAARMREATDLPRGDSEKNKAPTKLSEADAVANAVRTGKAAKLPQILDVAIKRSLPDSCQQEADVEEVTSQLLLTALRACAASHRFSEAIVAFDHLAARIGEGSANLWSVLLYIVVEAGAFERCSSIIKHLCKASSLSGHDFVNMVRCFAGQNDRASMQEMLDSLIKAQYTIDTYTMNRALAACGASESTLELAEAITAAGLCAEGLDAVGVNTLMKYNARAGNISRCFELRDAMIAKGTEASEVTFGILLDACVNVQELDRAREVFNDLCSSGLQLNVVHCTSFMKVLLSAQRLDEAAGVLREMVRSPGVKPDLITYSTLVKAYSEVGEVQAALNILQLMLSEGVKGDEIIFNSVLNGCATFPMNPNKVENVFETLVGHGLKPTTTTLSILLKALAHTQSWSLSLRVLEDAPRTFGIEPETRLYAQLVQACVKARHAETVLVVFDALLKAYRRQGKANDSVAVGRCLRSCVLASEVELVTQLWRRVQKDSIVVESSVERMVKSAIAKKTRGA